MMVDEISVTEIQSAFVESARAEDLEARMNALTAAIFAAEDRGSAEGWHLGGSGFGPNFMVVLEYAIDAPGPNGIDLATMRFFFYSGANVIAITQSRAAATARALAYAAANPDLDTLLVDSQLAGGSQGLTQMGMLVVAVRVPPG